MMGRLECRTDIQTPTGYCRLRSTYTTESPWRLPAVTPVAEAVHDAVDTGKDAFAQGPNLKSVHTPRWRKHAGVFVGAASLASALGFVAFLAFRKVMEAGKEHQAWKKEDTKLDQTIENSSEASDATATY